MGYERNDRRYGREGEYRGSSYGRGYDRDERGHRDDDRGFFDRAGDEVRSWFGDEDAERRRRQDERYDERGYGYGRPSGGYTGYSGRDRNPSRSYESGGRFADPAIYGGGSPGFGSSAFSGDRDTRAEWWRGEDHFQGVDRGQAVDRSLSPDRSPEYGRFTDRERDSYRNQHDESYRSWRDRQLQSLDRDYDEYRRENQTRFENEFGSWRQTREGQRGTLGQVREHQDVVGSDGSHVGTVDKVRGDRIILTKNDQDAGGHHHSIPLSWLRGVEGNQVTLTKTADEAKQAWKDEERNSALFGRDGDRSPGVHNLNRSFSGTY